MAADSRDDYRQITPQPERHKLTEGQQEIKSDFLNVTEEPVIRGPVTLYLTSLSFPKSLWDRQVLNRDLNSKIVMTLPNPPWSLICVQNLE